MQIRFVCISGALLVCQLHSGPGYAQSCVDSDGDGWGWNGTSSCQVVAQDNQATSLSATAETGSACIDGDGDGFGWNGTETCLVGVQATPAVQSATANTVNNTVLTCIDSDGDGWGWNGVESCQTASSNVEADTLSVDQVPQAAPEANDNTQVFNTPVFNTPAFNTPAVGNNRFDAQRDLVALHFDHAPDRDDGHAAVAALMVTEALQLDVQVVAGTHGVYSRDRYDSESEALMFSVWGSAWHNAHSNRPGSVAAAVNRWTSVLAAGGSVWVAEGGPSDFTAAVVHSINQNHTAINTRADIHVIQHSDWNEDHSLAEDLAYVIANTNYVKIADGNDPNSTADFRFESHNNGAFVSRAQAGRYASEWGVAFNYLSPNEKLDFSDTVELLHIVGIGTNLIKDVDDFADYFF